MTIEERVAKLERKNRRLTATLIFAGGTVAMLAVLAVAGCQEKTRAGNAPLDRVTARRFVVVDENGKTRAELDVIGGGAGLTLFDEKGKVRAALTVIDDMPGLTLFKNGKARAALAVIGDMPSLWLWDEKGKVLAQLGIGEKGPVLSLNDKGGVVVRTGEGGGGIVEVYNTLGKLVATMQANKANCGFVGVCDFNGKPGNFLVAE